VRIILYTGKGGVGKTTVSAATAVCAARLGYRTLVMSTDAAHSLGDSLDVSLSGEPAQVATNLWAQELDVSREVDRHWGTLQAWLRVLMAWRGVDDLLAEEMAVLPGMEEIAGLLYLLNYHETGEYDVIVVDTAPTGETLRLLSLPDVMQWWLRHVFPLQRVAARVTRPVLRHVTDLPLPDDQVFAAVNELFTRLQRTRDILTDGGKATVRLVLNPEKMVIKEAQRAYTYLSLYGYASDLIVCNRVLPRSVRSAYFTTWQRSQERYREQVSEAFAPLPILDAPLFEREVVGVAMLERFGEALFGGADPTHVWYEGHVQEVAERDGHVELAILLPFASKDEVRLQQVGDELVIQVGAQKRNVILPRSLAGAESDGARLEGNRLVISFRWRGSAPP
jgi:arsenite-transporting ATPase